MSAARVLALFSPASYPAAMPPASPMRRFPAPWRTVRTPGGWQVEDATGRPLAFVYGRDDQGASGTGLTVDEARRIAAGIARLPGLLASSRRGAK